MTVPTTIANRKPTSESRETDTHLKRHKGLKYKLTDPYRRDFFSGENVSSLDGLTGGIVMTDQQGCSVNMRREELRQNFKIFVPYQNHFLGHSAAKGISNHQKEKIVHGKEHATTTQS